MSGQASLAAIDPEPRRSTALAPASRKDERGTLDIAVVVRAVCVSVGDKAVGCALPDGASNVGDVTACLVA
jgi:hypothetical protein